MFGRHIEVQLDVSHPGPLVRADRDELELALLNIIGNACDAMPRGGRFSLSIGSGTDHALISIEDTGVGMTPEVLSRLFEPFFTTKPKEKGTGIGMAIVHRFVADSGGTLDVDSAPGEGTRIRIRLPLATQQDETLREAGTQVVRILLISGDPELLPQATKILPAHGYSLVQAANADEAISHALQSAAFDLAIADQVVQGADSPALLREIGRMLPKARLAWICEHFPDDLDDGIYRLRKPLAIEDLTEMLRAAESGHGPSRHG
jgi:CheY-like chemotaxis protein